MINNEQYIPCPVCSTKIPFNVQQLLQGVQFNCPNCHASVGLAVENKEIIRQSIDKLEKTKSEISKK